MKEDFIYVLNYNRIQFQCGRSDYQIIKFGTKDSCLYNFKSSWHPKHVLEVLRYHFCEDYNWELFENE